MSNNIEVFNNTQFGNIRVFNDNEGKVWFCGSDVATSLGYSNPQKAVRDHVTDKHKTLNETFTVNGTSVTLIDEAGLYRLVMRSQLPSAEDFQEWVTSEVLPSIRKHGMYATPVTIENMIADPDFAISLLNTLKEERIARQQAEEAKVIAEKERDVYSDMIDDVMQDDHTYTATEIAKDLGLRSANALNKWLVEIGFFYKSGKYYIPYSKYSQKGFTSHKLYDTGHGFNVKTIKFTNAGKIWIVEKWKAQHQLLLGL